MLLFFGWLMNYTTYGRNTMAIGGNQEADAAGGVNADRTKIIIFAVHGVIMRWRCDSMSRMTFRGSRSTVP